MITSAMPTETISNLKNNPLTVLSHVSTNPIMLLQNSKAAAIMVSPALWNQLLARLQTYERHELIRQRATEPQDQDISFDEFMKGLES